MTDRTVLITGCSSGIGEATAARLAGAGWTVYATARRPETLDELAASGCRTLALDVTDEESMSSAVDAVLGESGLIATNFDNAAVASMAGNDDGVYGDFNAQVARMTQEIYAGPIRYLGGGPDRVAKVIEKSLTARRPKIRYTVTPSASMSIGSRRLIGARAWDAALKSQFPAPLVRSRQND